MDNNNDGTLLTIDQLATAFNVARSTVYNWLDRGCPRYKVNAVTRFDLDEVKEWARDREGVA